MLGPEAYLRPSMQDAVSSLPVRTHPSNRTNRSKLIFSNQADPFLDKFAVCSSLCWESPALSSRETLSARLRTTVEVVQAMDNDAA